MKKKDLRALLIMAGSFVAYWAFCIALITQYSSAG